MPGKGLVRPSIQTPNERQGTGSFDALLLEDVLGERRATARSHQQIFFEVAQSNMGMSQKKVGKKNLLGKENRSHVCLALVF